MLYFENLFIRNCVPLRIIEFSLNQKINCHSNACLKVELNEGALEAMMCWKEYEPVTVADIESGCNLFAGVVRELKIYWERGIQEARIDLVSGTYLLDLEKKKYSYQKKQSYRELVEEVVPDKAMLLYLAREREISNLLVQYDETDWRFIDRLSSYLHTCIIPDINTSCEARFYFGIKRGGSRGNADVFSYREGLDSHYHNAKSRDKNRMKQEFVYYQIASYENYDIGDHVTFQGRSWLVGEKAARLSDGVLRFYYRLSKETYFERNPFFNSRLHGNEIQGTVKKCEKELLQIALETDKDKKRQNTFFYQWMPESGNLLYCMPEPGEQVALYFCEDDERKAICINSTRNNKDSLTEQWNPAHKQFQTHKNQKIQFRKDRMVIRNLDSYFSIDETQGISVCTEKEIHIQAVEQVEAGTGRLSVKSEQEIDLIKEDLFTPTMITLKDDITAKGGELQTEPKIWHDDKTIPDRVLDKGRDLGIGSKVNDGMGMLARR